MLTNKSGALTRTQVNKQANKSGLKEDACTLRLSKNTVTSKYFVDFTFKGTYE